MDTVNSGSVNPLFDKSYFDAIYRAFDDPWGISHHAYEHRKRALMLASLPQTRFHRAFEPGCANGELTALLAQCCDKVVAADLVDDAVDAARRRCAALAQVEVRRLRVPSEWPEGQFDLIVLSELAYYLDERDLQTLVQRVLDSLTDDGAVLACHWRHPIDGARFDGGTVHVRIDELSGLPCLVRHEEPDFVLHIWSADGRSSAEREGIL